MKPVLIILLAFLTCLSCASEEKVAQKPTIDDFKTHLKSDMEYAALVRVFGKPAKDIGSGIHIYVYALPDATEVWIGYTDKIVYARQLDEQGTVLLNIL
jgi:hypothetical protein